MMHGEKRRPALKLSQGRFKPSEASGAEASAVGPRIEGVDEHERAGWGLTHALNEARRVHRMIWKRGAE